MVKASQSETIRYANIVSFVCLKALAFEDRAERKDGRHNKDSAQSQKRCIQNG
jgi:hypothetical protein